MMRRTRAHSPHMLRRLLRRRAARAGLRDAGAKAARPTPVRVAPAVPLKALDPLFEDIEKRTFNFFWETTEGATGLVPDRWPAAPFASIAAVGFALNAYAVGVERGYVTRAQARARVLTTLRFLHAAPQGADPANSAGYQGFFYHFLNFGSGKRYGNSELSTVDTALLMAGVLFVGGYFDQDNADEAQIRKLADELYRRVNWPWSIEHVPDIRMAWSPEGQFQTHDWRGYNEAMLVYILALGSPDASRRRARPGWRGRPTTTEAGARSKGRRT